MNFWKKLADATEPVWRRVLVLIAYAWLKITGRG